MVEGARLHGPAIVWPWVARGIEWLSAPARLQLAAALGREFNCGPGPRLCNQLRMRLKPSLCTDGDLASSEVREPQTLRSDLETGSLALQFDHVGRACTLRHRVGQAHPVPR